MEITHLEKAIASENSKETLLLTKNAIHRTHLCNELIKFTGIRLLYFFIGWRRDATTRFETVKVKCISN